MFALALSLIRLTELQLLYKVESESCKSRAAKLQLINSVVWRLPSEQAAVLLE